MKEEKKLKNKKNSIKRKEVDFNMDEKTEVLIGLAAAFVAKCKPWFSHFSNQAQKNGIGNQEILEVVELAKRVRQGAMNQMDKFLTKKLGLENKSVDSDSQTRCGCSQ